MMLNIFSWTYWPFLILFLWEIPLQILCLFFNWVIGPFTVELSELFIYSGCNFLLRFMICKYVLPFCELFHILTGVLWNTKFSTSWSPMYFFLLSLLLYLKKNHCLTQRFISIFSTKGLMVLVLTFRWCLFLIEI